MYPTTKEAILTIIKEKKEVRPHDLIQTLNLTPAMIHRHLLDLTQKKLIEKVGKPPLVYYRLLEKPPADLPSFLLSENKIQTVEERYLYISLQGKFLKGMEGLYAWAKQTKQDKNFEKLAEEYLNVLKEADSFRGKNGLIDATERLKNIFGSTYLDKVFYQDFYSLPKFGKTALGQMVLHGKQAEDVATIRDIAHLINPDLTRLIQDEKIDALVWTPHSLPRKKPFLDVLKKALDLPPLPEIKVSKIFPGRIRIAQKSLSKLEERIENAEQTMVIRSTAFNFNKVLVIDDAVGSGATLHVLAKRLIAQKVAKKVIGYAVVGSYKGFEVIKEV